jgi:nucleotide-binding universal stress UspA family protein
MYRRILVPVDGSTTSKLGLRHAIGLAKNQGARLRFLNVMNDFMGVDSSEIPAATMSLLLQSARESGERVVAEGIALARGRGLNSDASLLHGRGRRASDVILKAAKKWRADLIVMGTHGRQGLNRLLLGSDAERVLRGTPVPLLLVRNQPERKRA